MKFRILLLPLALALAGAGCMSASPTPPAINTPPVAANPAPAPSRAPEPATSTPAAPVDTGIAVKKYSDPPTGFSFTYPATWGLATSTGDIKLTNLGPDGSDFITIKRAMGDSVTDTDSKFGDTMLRFDATTSQWMITQPDQNENEVERVATPDLMTDTGLPAFRSTGRWATYIVALSHTKFLIVNISGDGWTGGLDPFVKTITLSSNAPTAAQINADMQAILDSETHL
jgi:hypothetical protein